MVLRSALSANTPGDLALVAARRCTARCGVALAVASAPPRRCGDDDGAGDTNMRRIPHQHHRRKPLAMHP